VDFPYFVWPWRSSEVIGLASPCLDHIWWPSFHHGALCREETGALTPLYRRELLKEWFWKVERASFLFELGTTCHQGTCLVLSKGIDFPGASREVTAFKSADVKYDQRGSTDSSLQYCAIPSTRLSQRLLCYTCLILEKCLLLLLFDLHHIATRCQAVCHGQFWVSWF
jgi:hypothetical protein